MWQIDNRTPFAAERTWVAGPDGAAIWILAVKCTFDVLPDGTTGVSGEQPPVVRVPEYLNPSEPTRSSLKYDSDLVQTKITTDIILLGHAYAPQGRPVTDLDIGFRVGPVVKRLHVTGDRVWQGSDASSPRAFLKMPLTYERSFGGFDPQSRDTPEPQWDVRNPVGTGFAVSASRLTGLKLPNVEYPDRLVRNWDDRPPPAGTGPICAHWEPRARLAGTYDDKWQHERFPLLPDDFDDRHYQCAPADQQPPHFLTGGEPVALINLDPTGDLRFELPHVFLRFETRFYTGERQEHDPPKLHTVIIEPDLRRVSLVWHSDLPCHGKRGTLRSTEITQNQIAKPVAGGATPERGAV